jgi:DNA-binding NarL/FixJ family response regulator
MARLKILLADGHDIVRRGLRSLLTSHPGWAVCGDTRSGLDAIQMTVELKPDILILSLEMADLNGIEVIRQVKRSRPTTQVLVYTGHDEEYLTVEALKAGANGHVLKSDREDTLVEAVNKLANHMPYFSTIAAETLLGRLAKTPATVDTHALTTREREIVQFVADGKSNKDIAINLQISVKTVEAHRSAIMRKLGFKSITELVRYAIRNKLIQA